jgi:hypothetical protein
MVGSLFTLESDAAITAAFSAGATCNGAPTAEFKAGGPAQQVSLCVSTTSEWLCGSTVKLQSAKASENAKFRITAIKHAANFADPNTTPVLPMAIVNPAPTADLGSTTAGSARNPGPNQLMVTFQIAANEAATRDSYVLSLSSDSVIGAGVQGSCANATDAPIAADFTFTRKK